MRTARSNWSNGLAQTLSPERLITLIPISDRLHAQTELRSDGCLVEPLFQIQLHGPQLQREGIALAG